MSFGKTYKYNNFENKYHFQDIDLPNNRKTSHNKDFSKIFSNISIHCFVVLLILFNKLPLPYVILRKTDKLIKKLFLTHRVCRDIQYISRVCMINIE